MLGPRVVSSVTLKFFRQSPIQSRPDNMKLATMRKWGKEEAKGSWGYKV